MILVGNRRGGAAELAAHLLNVEDNEHVELHEVRGFVSHDLGDALHEAYGIPAGFKRKEDANPLNYSHAEHSQAKRAKRDVKELKHIFKACREQSDTRDTFAHALKCKRLDLI